MSTRAHDQKIIEEGLRETAMCADDPAILDFEFENDEGSERRDAHHDNKRDDEEQF